MYIRKKQAFGRRLVYQKKKNQSYLILFVFYVKLIMDTSKIIYFSKRIVLLTLSEIIITNNIYYNFLTTLPEPLEKNAFDFVISIFKLTKTSMSG